MKNLKYKKFVRLGHKFLWSENVSFFKSRQDIYTCEKCNCKVLVYDNDLCRLYDFDQIQSIQLRLYCNEYIIKSIIE